MGAIWLEKARHTEPDSKGAGFGREKEAVNIASQLETSQKAVD